MRKIKAVRTYQSVLFEGSQNTHFTSESIAVYNKPSVNIEIIDNAFIELKTEKDQVYVPLSNIAGIYFFNQSDEDKKKSREVESKKAPTGKAQDIKKPK